VFVFVLYRFIMGQGASSATQQAKLKSDFEVISVLMPIYFTDEEVTSQDIQDAHKSWNMILEDKTQPFLEMKENSTIVSLILVMVMYFFFCLLLSSSCFTVA